MRLLLIPVFALALSAHAATTLEVVLPDQVTTSAPFQFTVTARNGAAVDSAYTGTVHFTSSDAGATLPADYTFTPADAGTHTFTATLASGGMHSPSANHTITATDTASSSITGTDVTTVFWATNVVRRIVPDAPDPVTRTTPFDVVVRAVNAYFDVVPTYTGTVHFRGTDGVVLPADYTFTPADAGVHTFSVTANRGGYHVITAEDVAEPVTGSSDTFNVLCPELTATAGNDGPSCPSQATRLFATSNQTDVTYSWSGPHGWFSTLQNPDAPVAGTYFVTVRNADDCTASAQTVVVHRTVARPSIDVPADLCGPGPLTATLANASSFSNIVWSVQNGQIVSGQGTASVQITPTASSGTMVVGVQGTDNANGCTSVQSNEWIDIHPALSAEITIGGNMCTGGPRTASVPDAGVGAQYEWSIINGTLPFTHLRSVTWSPSGTADVTLSVTVTQPGSCISQDSETVPAGGGPRAEIDTDTTICEGASATIPVELTGTPPFSITWSDGVTQSGIDTNTASRTVSPEQYTEYTIASVTDANCSGSATGQARIQVDPELDITRQPRNTSVANGSTATLTVEASGEVTWYQWYRGATGDRSQPIPGSNSPSYTTPPLTRTTSYWVEIFSACHEEQSGTATVTVRGSGRRRSVRR